MQKTKSLQSKIFVETEGDNSFLRNGQHFNKAIYDAVMKLNPPKSNHILEIGCGCGTTLKRINKKFESEVYGIDVSKKAIAYAKEKNKVFNATVSSWENYSPKMKFDIVINGGYFYVTEEKYLMKAIDKLIDLTKKNGFIIIWDYDSATNYTNKWKHDMRLRSYKRNLTRIFAKYYGDKLYLISKELYFHDGKTKFNFAKFNKDSCCSLMVFQKLY